LIDSAIAKDHHADAENHSKSHEHKDADRMRGSKGKGKGRDTRRSHNPINLLFGNLDLSDEQRDQVGSIMQEQMEKGKNQREGFKSETRDRLAAVLTDEQLRGFEENSMRMERRKEHMKDMDRKKGKDGRKGYKKKKRGYISNDHSTIKLVFCRNGRTLAGIIYLLPLVIDSSFFM
jgi:Spy/CpxP family protein refolding chaperone